MNREEYQEYLRGEHWRGVRLFMLGLADGRCALCGGGDELQVHHNNYDCLWRETVADVVVLCHDCHLKSHKMMEREQKGPCFVR